MSTEKNKDVVRRYYDEVLNKGNWAFFDELHAPDFVYHHGSRTNQRTIQGSAEIKQSFMGVLTALPDMHITVEDMIAEGDRVLVLFSYSGTHKGDYFGIPPTGKQVTVTGIDIVRFDENGKYVEEWVSQDLMQQLGVTPSPGQAS